MPYQFGGKFCRLYRDLHPEDTAASSSTMAFKPPCITSSCDCGGDTCKSLYRQTQNQDRGAGKSLRKIDLGPVPSPAEVDAAVTALQSFLQENFSYESMSKWLQPVMNCYDSRILLSDAYQWVCKAFQWLLTDPSFKGLVISLCLDKAVWDAILKNGIMEKLQELPSSDGNGSPGSSTQGPHIGSIILRWILETSLTKIMELIQSFLILLNEAFRFPGREKLKAEKRDEIDEKIQSSLLLSLVVLLIVVVARAQIA